MGFIIAIFVVKGEGTARKADRTKNEGKIGAKSGLLGLFTLPFALLLFQKITSNYGTKGATGFITLFVAAAPLSFPIAIAPLVRTVSSFPNITARLISGKIRFSEKKNLGSGISSSSFRIWINRPVRDGSGSSSVLVDRASDHGFSRWVNYTY